MDNFCIAPLLKIVAYLGFAQGVVYYQTISKTF